MIKTLSPHYLTISFIAPFSGLICTEYTLRIFIWNGSKLSPPSLPTYQITKENATGSDGSLEINIAKFVNDYIDFTPNADNQVWVKTDVIYKTSVPTDYTAPSNSQIQLAVKGYGYGMEGKNPQLPFNNILIPVQDYNVNDKFIVPIYVEEPLDNAEIILTSVVPSAVPNNFIYTFTLNFVPTSITMERTITAFLNDFNTKIILPNILSPQTIEMTGASNFKTRLRAISPVSNTVIYSNTIVIT